MDITDIDTGIERKTLTRSPKVTLLAMEIIIIEHFLYMASSLQYYLHGFEFIFGLNLLQHQVYIRSIK